MRAQTRQRVLNAINRLGYRANASARSMRTGIAHMIGLAMPGFQQPFMAYLVNEVIVAAAKCGYGVALSLYNERMGEALAQTDRFAVDGWILFAVHPLDHAGRMLRRNIPLVVVGDYLSYGMADSVTMPNVEAVRHVAGRLLEQGVQRIGLIGASDVTGVSSEGVSSGASHIPDAYVTRILGAGEGTQELRTRGYLEALHQQGVSADGRLVVSGGRWTVLDGTAAMGLMLNAVPEPDVVICLNDALALGAMHELQERGLKVPQDVQVIGFDNIEESRYSNPTLTTIDPHVSVYAERAVSMLIERVNGYDGPVRRYVTDFTLIDRGSTMPESRRSDG